MAETVSTRVKRLEESMARAFASIDALAEKQTKLDDVVVLLTEAQIRTEERFRETDERFGQLEERFRETDERFRQTDERFRQTAAEAAERSRHFDERVDKLVSAIGEFLRRNGGKNE